MNHTDTLKLALEALENTTPTGFNMERDKQFFAAITALRRALEQPAQQEQCPTCGEFEPRTGTCGTSVGDLRALCNRAAPQQAQRKPLTDDELEARIGDWTCRSWGDRIGEVRRIARAIEAAHGITGEKK